jgi:protocatechuate 3,4-dioxygenase beta subunit
MGYDTKRVNRREVLGLLGAGAVLAMGCDNGTPTSPTSGTADTTSTSTTTTTTTTTTPPPSSSSSCAVTPNETAGPYPSLTDLFRADIRENTAGTPLTLTLRVVAVNRNCAAVTNANVEIWHCDIAGNYSQYGNSRAETFLRGIQTTNANGEVTFTTNYPGWYQGRATHIHIEVTINNASVKVTQLAFPESVNNVVHTQGVYASRGRNPTSNASDGIFADSLSAELTTPSGDPASGYSALFVVGVNT